MDKLFSVERAAELLGGISHWTVRCWLRDRKLRRTKVGARTMVAESELRRFLREQKKPAIRKRESEQGVREGQKKAGTLRARQT